MSEIYEGTKFKYIEIQKTFPKHTLITDLKKWVSFFEKQNLAPPYPGGSSGNLSFRIKPGSDQFIITCSHTKLSKTIDDSDFSEVIECNLKENIVSANGLRAPSSESFMHYLIYKKRPDINAVLHGHSFEILAYSDLLNIPVTYKELPYGTIELAEDASNLLKNTNFAIMKNHGFISTGKTIDEAGNKILDILKTIRHEN